MITALRNLALVVVLFASSAFAQFFSFYGYYMPQGAGTHDWYYFYPCYDFQDDGFTYRFYAMDPDGFWHQIELWKLDWWWVEVKYYP